MRFIPRFAEIPGDNERICKLAESMHLPVPLARCLVQRGIQTQQQAEAYFSGGLELLHDPFQLDGMQEAVDCIETFIWDDAPITVYGDYDVDGTCATSILLDHLSSLGVSQVDFRIPSRHSEGYGLHEHTIRELAAKGTKLLITVDCGISNEAEVKLAKSLGMSVVITDHHECPDVLPIADAIVNPKKPNQCYPFFGLCGTAVAGKLVEALSGTDAMLEYVDLIALATVADLVPLVDENRVLVRMGLEAINQAPRPGMRALIETASLTMGKIQSGHLGFQLAPRINAGGRIDLAGKSVTLLTTSDDKVAMAIAMELNENNRTRQIIEKQMLSEAQTMMDVQIDLGAQRGIVLWNEKWNSGVLGIVASRLVELYHRPTVLLGGDGDAFYGSGRSVPGVNLYEVLVSCKDCFLRYGGHEQAAGMAVAREKLELFRDAFNAALSQLDDLLFVQVRQYDTILPLADITLDLADQIRRMEPLGMGNPTPIFLSQGVTLQGTERMGKEGTHYRTYLSQQEKQISAVAFRQDPPEQAGHYKVLLQPQINEFRGQSRLQVMIHTVCYENRTDDLRQVLDARRNQMNRSYFSQLLLPVSEDGVPTPTVLSLGQLRTMLQKKAIGTLLIASTYEAAMALLEEPWYEACKDNFTVAWRKLEGVIPGQNCLLLAPQWEALVVTGYSRILFLDGKTSMRVVNCLANQLHNSHYGVIMKGNSLGMARYEGPSPWDTSSMRNAFAVIRTQLRQPNAYISQTAAVEDMAKWVQVPVWRMYLALTVFCELDLIGPCSQPPYYQLSAASARTQLDCSPLWRDICDLAGHTL